MKKVLTVYLPTKTETYIQGQDGVSEIRPVVSASNFWYWQVVFDTGEWMDINAPAILEHCNIE